MFQKDKFQERRLEMQLSMQKVAANVGVSRATVKNWETGVSQPTKVQTNALAKFLKVMPDYLLSDSDSESESSSPAENSSGKDFTEGREIQVRKEFKILSASAAAEIINSSKKIKEIYASAYISIDSSSLDSSRRRNFFIEESGIEDIIFKMAESGIIEPIVKIRDTVSELMDKGLIKSISGSDFNSSLCRYVYDMSRSMFISSNMDAVSQENISGLAYYGDSQLKILSSLFEKFNKENNYALEVASCCLCQEIFS